MGKGSSSATFTTRAREWLASYWIVFVAWPPAFLGRWLAMAEIRRSMRRPELAGLRRVFARRRHRSALLREATQGAKKSPAPPAATAAVDTTPSGSPARRTAREAWRRDLADGLASVALEGMGGGGTGADISGGGVRLFVDGVELPIDGGYTPATEEELVDSSSRLRRSRVAFDRAPPIVLHFDVEAESGLQELVEELAPFRRLPDPGPEWEGVGGYSPLETRKLPGGGVEYRWPGVQARPPSPERAAALVAFFDVSLGEPFTEEEIAGGLIVCENAGRSRRELAVPIAPEFALPSLLKQDAPDARLLLEDGREVSIAGHLRSYRSLGVDLYAEYSAAGGQVVVAGVSVESGRIVILLGGQEFEIDVEAGDDAEIVAGKIAQAIKGGE